MICRTDSSGPHRWEWTIAWRGFTRSGTATTPSGVWDFGTALANCGGTLDLRVSAGANFTTATLFIKGTNPSPAEISAYLFTKPDSAGMDRIIAHESNNRQFDRKGEPLRSFDNGYGLCQVTNPAPNIDQVWNWKSSVDLGLTVMAQKRSDAVRYLSAKGRSYTALQLRYETVSRWNGGPYHEWDDSAGRWIRRAAILCDPTAGNIGWDMTRTENHDRSLRELRDRDHGTYGRGRRSGDLWGYYGVCYADHVLG
jgi:hypothetical protein